VGCQTLTQAINHSTPTLPIPSTQEHDYNNTLTQMTMEAQQQKI